MNWQNLKILGYQSVIYFSVTMSNYRAKQRVLNYRYNIEDQYWMSKVETRQWYVCDQQVPLKLKEHFTRHHLHPLHNTADY